MALRDAAPARTVSEALPDRYRRILESRFRGGSSIGDRAVELRALRLAAQVNDEDER